jgi:hypothetical protein
MRLALVMLSSLLAACSSSSADGTPGGHTGESGDAFSRYCTGTLKTEQRVLAASGGGWADDGIAAPVGATFFVSARFGRWGGYVIRASGQPAELLADKGLTKEVDFTSDCANDPTLESKMVMLADATLYPNTDLSGTPCTLTKGTELHDYDLHAALGERTRLSSREIKETCGLDTAYSANAYWGALLPR